MRNRLSTQTTRALLCLGAWSAHGFVQHNHLADVAKLPELAANHYDVESMEVGWDAIDLVRAESDRNAD